MNPPTQTADPVTHSRESLRGQAFTLILNARVGGSVPDTVSRWERAATIRQACAAARQRWVTLWRETDRWAWRVAPVAGIDFARQIETALKASDAVDQSLLQVVLVPLDQRIYLAELHQGTVTREWVEAEAQAVRRVADYDRTGIPLRVIDSGIHTALVADFKPAVLPWTLQWEPKQNPYRFRPAWQTLAFGVRLPSRPLAYGGVLALGIALAGGVWFYRAAADDPCAWPTHYPDEMAIDWSNESDEDAKLDLLMARYNLTHFADPLATAGAHLDRLVITARAVCFQGTAEQLPTAVSKWAEENPSSHYRTAFDSTTQCWSLIRPRPANEPTTKPFLPSERETKRQAHDRFREVVELNGAQYQPLREITGDRYTLLDFTVRFSHPYQSLDGLTDLVHQQPYQLFALRCDFDGTRATVCEAAFRFHY